MRLNGWTWLLAGAVLAGSMAQVPPPDPLTRARQAYNDGQFDAAIAAAREALRVPASANAAAVVLGRAHLEKFKVSAEAAELDSARVALAQVQPDRLAPRERIEFHVGLGVAMFLDGCNGGCFTAAAEFFSLALDAASSPELADRETIFEWWAGALDRQAQFGPEGERGLVYRRILDRADAEQARNEYSASAAYWVAAGARGVGDFERAWGAAISGWVRAKYLGARGETLRADLDRFVTRVLLPERAKYLIPDADPGPTLTLLQAQWAEIKQKYQ